MDSLNCLSPDLHKLCETIHYHFKDKNLLFEALTHTSMHKSKKSYERLEFLGDRVLGLIVAEELYERLPHEVEGELAKRHAQLVRTETLAEIAVQIGVGDYIRMAKGEANTGGRHKVSLLSDVMEALVAAIYKDGGLDAARKFIQCFWKDYFTLPLTPERDSKTSLQELSQGKGFPTPVYNVIDITGPPHNPVFTVEVVVEGLGSAMAKGSSKRNAEKEAAEILRKKLLIDL